MTKRQRNYKGKQRRRRYAIESTINPLPYLPENIIEEILRKLPGKAMARSKSVCKTWNSIISSPKFMEYYHKNIRQVEGNLLIFLKHKYDYMWGSRINFCTLSPRNGNTIVDTDPLKYYIRNRYQTKRVIILGSCNGLVAILYDCKLILWNPLTKQHSFIQVDNNLAGMFCSSYSSKLYLFGLCYDSSKDESIIVVRFVYYRRPWNLNDDIGDEGNSYVSVNLYNFKYGHKRQYNIRPEFKLLDRNLLHGDIGKVICGLPHWVLQYYDFIDPTIVKKDILYFDLNEAEFKKMARPDGSDGKTMLGLATLDGENQLGCVLHDIVYAKLEVWVMKEYGNSESWSNMLTFPYINMLVDDGRSINYMNIHGFMPSGELIVNLNDKEFWVYDINKGNPREMKSRFIDFDLAIVCEPTLISPPESVVGNDTEDEYKYEYRYQFKYNYEVYEYDYDGYDNDHPFYAPYKDWVLYDMYATGIYAKWSNLRSRMGKKHYINCM